MAKQTQAFLTFAVTLPQQKGSAIPTVRQDILSAIAKEFDIKETEIKCYLTNKEVKYG